MNKKGVGPILYALLFPVFLAVLLATLSFYKIPFSMPMPPHLYHAKELLATGHVSTGFWPVGYIGFLAACLKLGGKASIFLGQGLVYVSIVILTFILFRILGSSHHVASLGSCLVALHPYLFVNIKRIIDSNLAVFFILAFCIATFSAKRSREQYTPIILWGCLLGLFVSVRLNAISLSAVPFIVLCARDNFKIYRYMLKIVLFFLAAFITLAFVTTLIKGSPAVSPQIPQNAIYDLLVGANEYVGDSAYGILKHHTGEIAFRQYLKSKGLSYCDHSEEANERYLKLALEYIFQHPFRYAWFCVLRVVNLFRPYYRNVGEPTTINSFYLKVTAQTVMAFPFFLWISSIILNRRLNISGKSQLIAPIVILYILPFVLTDAEPRHRLPVDIIMIADGFYRFSLVFVRDRK